LPTAPRDGVTLTHEKPIAGVFDRAWIVARRRIVQKSNNPLATAIGGVKEHLAIASFRVHRFENTKVGPVLDPPARILRRFVEIDENLIESGPGIDFPVSFADQFFVRPGDRKFVPASERFSSLYRAVRDHDCPAGVME
jgi:hypothetical protein